MRKKNVGGQLISFRALGAEGGREISEMGARSAELFPDRTAGRSEVVSTACNAAPGIPGYFPHRFPHFIVLAVAQMMDDDSAGAGVGVLGGGFPWHITGIILTDGAVGIWILAVLDIEWGNDTGVLEIVRFWGYCGRFYIPAACGMTTFEYLLKKSPGE